MKQSAQRTGELIIEMACNLFEKHGFSNVSIEQICDAVGIKRSTFYLYFSGKEEIAYDSYMTHKAYTPDRIAWIIGAQTPTEQAVRLHLCVNGNNYTQAGKEIAAAQFRYILQKKNKADGFGRAGAHSLLVPIIRQAKNMGEFLNPMQEEELANAVLLAHFGLHIIWSVTDDLDYIQAFSDNLKTIYCVRQDIDVKTLIENNIHM